MLLHEAHALFCMECTFSGDAFTRGVQQALTSGDQNAPLSSLELIQCSYALGLSHLTVDRDCIKSQVTQHEGHLASVVAGACEDHEGSAC